MPNQAIQPTSLYQYYGFLVIFGAAIPFDFRMYKRFSDVFCFIWEVLLKKNADVLKN